MRGELASVITLSDIPHTAPYRLDNVDVPLPFDEPLDDALRAWRQRGLAAGHADRTIDARIGTLRRLRRDGIDPLAAEYDDLERWLAELPLARSSKSTYRAHLMSWFGWLEDTGRRDDNPASKLPPVRPGRGIPHPITPAEVAGILDACSDARAATTRAYVILGAYAGLRVHEIAKFKSSDLRGGELWVVGKGGTSLSVPAHPIIADLAAEMPRGYWFPSSAPSGHVHRCSVSTAIQRAMKRAGVVGVPHGLRHHFCTQVLRASGGDLRTTQRAARHASPATTAIYTQVADETLNRAVFGIPAA